MKTKEQFHQLIDAIEDEKMLKAYYELVKMLSGTDEGKLTRELSPAQQEDLLKSYEESFDEDQLVDHEEMKRQYKKWL
jgi:hypothetical protein